MNRRNFIKRFLAISGSILSTRNVDTEKLKSNFNDFTSEQIKEVAQINNIDVKSAIPKNVYYLVPHTLLIINKKDGTIEDYWLEKEQDKIQEKYGNILDYFILDTTKLDIENAQRIGKRLWL